jgi:isopentenyldiphosphate isomerase
MSFTYPPALQEYAMTEREYLEQHPELSCVCTGAVVFNKEGKMLLVQRAKEESAFPNLWVSLAGHETCTRLGGSEYSARAG